MNLQLAYKEEDINGKGQRKYRGISAPWMRYLRARTSTVVESER